MNKTNLRAACKAAGISYGSMTVADMRAALAARTAKVEKYVANNPKPAAPATTTPAPVAARPAPVVRAVAAAKPAATLVRCEVKNGARKPVKGVCADVWAWLAAHRDAEPADLRAWAEKKGLNVGNAMQERSAFRRSHGITSQDT